MAFLDSRYQIKYVLFIRAHTCILSFHSTASFLLLFLFLPILILVWLTSAELEPPVIILWSVTLILSRAHICSWGHTYLSILLPRCYSVRLNKVCLNARQLFSHLIKQVLHILTVHRGYFEKHYVFLVGKLRCFLVWDSPTYPMRLRINDFFLNQVSLVACEHNERLIHISKVSGIFHPLFHAIIGLTWCDIVHYHDSLTIFDVTGNQTFKFFLAGGVPKI